jgi:hypothetical protein
MKFILYRNPESRAQKIPFPAMQAAELADAEELTVQTGAGSILISRKNLTVRQALATLTHLHEVIDSLVLQMVDASNEIVGDLDIPDSLNEVDEDVLDELLGNGASIVAHFAKAKTLFEDAKYHNCVFLGTDEQGVPRHAHKRSCNSVGKAFRQNIEGSDPRYSFHHIGTDGQLFVFEAPIDLLSYITMHPEDLQSHSYVACCGTSAIPVLSMLERISSPKEVYLCLDNDQAGETGSLRMAEKIAEQFNIASDRLLPEHKDWNDALCARNQEQIQAAMSMGMQV